MSAVLRERVPPPARPWVFAVEDTTAQITWRSLPIGPVRFRAADCTIEVVGDGGPGSVELTGLPAASTVELRVDGPDLPRSWAQQTFTTLAPPPGEELARFATVSDMHIGEVAFGIRSALLEHPVPAEAHPVRALAAALEAIAAWGADALVVKGDLTHAGRAKDWAQVGRLLAGARTPVHVMLGNHDHYGPAGEPVPSTALAPFGIAPIDGTGQWRCRVSTS